MSKPVPSLVPRCYKCGSMDSFNLMPLNMGSWACLPCLRQQWRTPLPRPEQTLQIEYGPSPEARTRPALPSLLWLWAIMATALYVGEIVAHHFGMGHL